MSRGEAGGVLPGEIGKIALTALLAFRNKLTGVSDKLFQRVAVGEFEANRVQGERVMEVAQTSQRLRDELWEPVQCLEKGQWKAAGRFLNGAVWLIENEWLPSVERAALQGVSEEAGLALQARRELLQEALQVIELAKQSIPAE